jgi:hypothetical protein
MKKLALLLSVAMLMSVLICFTACNKDDNVEDPDVTSEEPTNDGEPSDGTNPAPEIVLNEYQLLMKELYENVDTSDLEAEGLPNALINFKLTPEGLFGTEGDLANDNISFYLGADDIPFIEGIVSMPTHNIPPHEIVLIRMEEDADIEAEIEKIKAGLDHRKWINAFIDEEDIIVDSKDDLVIVIMSDDSEVYHTAFKAL